MQRGVKVAQPYLILCNLMDNGPPGSSVHGDTRAAMRACRSRGELAGGLLCPAAPAAIISLQSKWMEVWLRKGRGLMAAGET